MLQITRAMADEDADAETDEQAYAELVEYLRIAAQLTYEELVEIREAQDGGSDKDGEAEVLH